MAGPNPWQRTSIHRSSDLAADAAELIARRHTRSQAAERLGVNRDALDQAMRRAAVQQEAA
jgi:DNA-binding phage protein